METQSREYTTDEIREMFLDQIRTNIWYWSQQTDQTCEQRLYGLAFSILSMLDGATMTLPRFVIAPDPHPEDREYHIEQGENWFPENHASTINGDIGGGLHEYFAAGGMK